MQKKMEDSGETREQLRKFASERAEMEEIIMNNPRDAGAFWRYIRNSVPGSINHAVFMKLTLKLMKKYHKDTPLIRSIIKNQVILRGVIKVTQCAMLAGNRHYLQILLNKIAELKSMKTFSRMATPVRNFTDYDLLTSPNVLFAPEFRMSSAEYNNIADLLSEETRYHLRLFTEDLYADVDISGKKIDYYLKRVAAGVNADREFGRTISSSLLSKTMTADEKYLYLSKHWWLYQFGRDVFARILADIPDYLFTRRIEAPAKLAEYFPETFSKETIINGLARYPRSGLIDWVAFAHTDWLYCDDDAKDDRANTETDSRDAKQPERKIRKELRDSLAINLFDISDKLSSAEIVNCARHALENNIDIKIYIKSRYIRLMKVITGEYVREFANILTEYIAKHSEFSKCVMKPSHKLFTEDNKKLQEKYCDYPVLLRTFVTK